MIVVFLLFTTANAVYFTMTDIQARIPSNNGKVLRENRPLITLYAQGNSTKRFILTDKTENLRIMPSDGNILFTKNFFKNIATINQITSTITVQDSKQNDTTTYQIEIEHLKSLDCEYFVEDLCYWRSVDYRIRENTEPTIIGSLTSSYLTEICVGYKINYTIQRNNDFSLIKKPVWAIKSRNRFDREDNNHIVQPINIVCIVENAQREIREVPGVIDVIILDVDDNPPVPLQKEFNIEIPSSTVKKGQEARHVEQFFVDKDSYEVNDYSAKILNDTLGILSPNCTKYPNEHSDERIKQTAIFCKFTFIKDMKLAIPTYSVILQLNDTNLINMNPLAKLKINFLFLNETGHHPALLKKPLLLYPMDEVKILRTATPFARIIQPINEKLKDARSFRLSEVNINFKIFNVTHSGGIVYLEHIQYLSTAPENISLNISWIRSNKFEYDLINIQLISESRPYCQNISKIPVENLDWCSNYKHPDECVNSSNCPISTGGSSSIHRSSRQEPPRCMWRGEKNPGQKATHLYATCTPDLITCPDGICDPLEDLYDGICPQDCSRQVSFPTSHNTKTGRGIGVGTGVCHCDVISCYCDKLKKLKKTVKTNTTAIIKANILETNNTQRVGNLTASKVLDIDLKDCGTLCILGILTGALFLIGAIATIVVCWRLDKFRKTRHKKFGDDSQEMVLRLSDCVDERPVQPTLDPLPLNFNMTAPLADMTVLNIIKKYEPDPKWEFPRNQLVIEQTLGEGEFGRVLRAKAMNIAGQTGYTTVAVKTLKDDARETELNDLLSEYQLLKEVSHPNIIRLLGVCTSPGGPIYLIIEFAEHGSLRNYLRRSRHLKSETWRLPSSTGLDDTEIHYDEPKISQVTPKEILSFAWQICKGMAYLSDIKLVHRDLAARNVLLAAGKVCKISDFGLTRDIYEEDAYFKRSKGRVPVKWMAPESLSDHIYTNKSDVWSFGILVWELVTLGATPYPGIAVQNLFHLLRQGYRMERPDNCSETLYNIMKNCWHIDSEQRPTFHQLSQLFERMLSDQVEYLDLTNNSIHNRSYFCTQIDDNNSSPDSIKADIPKLMINDEIIDKNQINPVNYLTKSLSYVKCGSSIKLQDLTEQQQDNNQNNINTQGYETPVKIVKDVKTPTNDCPQYYTDMAAKDNNLNT